MADCRKRFDWKYEERQRLFHKAELTKYRSFYKYWKPDIAPDEEVSYFGYFDVSFRIDKYGKAKRVRFLSEGGEVTRNMEIRLNQYLQNALFRPLFRDGKPYTDAISVRYYIAIWSHRPIHEPSVNQA